MERIVSQSLFSWGICLSIGSFGRNPNVMVQEQVGVCLLCFDFVFHVHLVGSLQGLLPQAFFRGCRGMVRPPSQKEKRVTVRTAWRSSRTRLYHQVWKWLTSLHMFSWWEIAVCHPSVPKESELSPYQGKCFQAEGLLTCFQWCEVLACLVGLVWAIDLV